MDKVNLNLLKDELKTQTHAYRFNKSAEDILSYFNKVNSTKDFQISSDIEFRNILTAKNEWESCVDSLGYQAIIILDENLNVIRANRTIEHWGWAEVNKVAGMHILNLIKPAIENDSIYDWVGEWCQIDTQTNAEWESYDNVNGKHFRFSFYPNRDIDGLHHNVDCYATLLISDITNKKPIKGKNSFLSSNDQEIMELEPDSPDQVIHSHFKRHSEERLHQLAEQLINSHEYERKRVSSELHDGIGQILSALKYQVESVVVDSENSTRQRKNDIILTNVLDNIKVALSELRRISVDLRPSILDDLGLLMTLSWFAGEFNKVYTELEVELQLDVSESDISEENKNVIYRIVQEAMNNSAKHSHANNIILQLTKSDVGILLRVSDDGCGFDVNNVKSVNGSGLGLKNMEERAINAGADFTMSSSAFLGTTVKVFWKTD